MHSSDTKEVAGLDQQNRSLNAGHCRGVRRTAAVTCGVREGVHLNWSMATQLHSLQPLISPQLSSQAGCIYGVCVELCWWVPCAELLHCPAAAHATPLPAPPASVTSPHTIYKVASVRPLHLDCPW